MRQPNVRIFLTAGDASLGRNGNYSDATGSSYSWDTTVQNSALPKAGDLVLVRTKQAVSGISMITSIETENGWKSRARCEKCSSTKLKWVSKDSLFRCAICSAKGANPSVELLTSLTKYHAVYDWFFTPQPGISLSEVRAASLTPKSIQSIQSAEPETILSMLTNDALWRLGYSKNQDGLSRVVQISRGRNTRIRVTTEKKCDLTGIDSPDEMVAFECAVFSTETSTFTSKFTVNILEILACHLESGMCTIDSKAGSLVVRSALENGIAELRYPLKPSTAELTKWLTCYSTLAI